MGQQLTKVLTFIVRASERHTHTQEMQNIDVVAVRPNCATVRIR